MSYSFNDKDNNRLPFPTKKVGSPSNYIEVYIIPDSDKADVLKKLHPYVEKPKLSDKMIDLHTGKKFIVKDFMVVRERMMDCLVSPYYLEGGGSVIDWVSVKEYESEEEDEDCDDDLDDDPLNPEWMDENL